MKIQNRINIILVLFTIAVGLCLRQCTNINKTSIAKDSIANVSAVEVGSDDWSEIHFTSTTHNILLLDRSKIINHTRIDSGALILRIKNFRIQEPIEYQII